MSEQVLQAFMEKKEFNAPELALRLQADIILVKEVLDYLVNLGKLRVKRKKSPRAKNVPPYMFLGCRCSISGPCGETYVLAENRAPGEKRDMCVICRPAVI